MGSKHCVVEIAAKDKPEAEKIAREVLNSGLAACANILPGISSIYWWEGTLEESKEVLLLLKTRKEKVKELIKKVKALHSYRTPAILVFEIKEANEDYLRWIDSILSKRIFR